MCSRIPNGNICTARNAAAISRQNERSAIASHASPCCLGCIRAAGERPVKEASFVGNGNHSRVRFMFLTECDFLVSVSGEITVIPGGTCAHVNTRIPGLLINGIRPVLASFALRGKQPEFSGLRFQKKKHNNAVHCERSRETGLRSLDALKKKEKIATKCK